MAPMTGIHPTRTRDTARRSGDRPARARSPPGGLVADGDPEHHLADGLTLLASVEEREVADVDDGEDDPDDDDAGRQWDW